MYAPLEPAKYIPNKVYGVRNVKDVIWEPGMVVDFTSSAGHMLMGCPLNHLRYLVGNGSVPQSILEDALKMIEERKKFL
jgi:hypothetical protein